jgi:hypothetical protein
VNETEAFVQAGRDPREFRGGVRIPLLPGGIEFLVGVISVIEEKDVVLVVDGSGALDDQHENGLLQVYSHVAFGAIHRESSPSSSGGEKSGQRCSGSCAVSTNF